MSTETIRPAYSMWPQYNRRLREVVAAMTDEQLAIRPAPDLLPHLGRGRSHRRDARLLAVRGHR